MATGKGVKLSMDMDDREVKKGLALILKRGKDLRPYWKRLGTWMAYRSVEKTFRKRGRPKWDVLAPFTIAMRRWGATSKNAPSPRRAFTKKILEVTGGLRGSFTFRAVRKWLDVGTAYINAEAHQFGKWVKSPKGWERPMVKIPQRRLIAIYAEDKKKAVEFALRYVEKG